MSNNGQVGIEFLLSVGVIMVVFIILLPIVLEKRLDYYNTLQIVQFNSECEEIADIITGVFVDGHDTQVEHKLNNPVQIFNKTVWISNVSCSLPFQLNYSTPELSSIINVINVNGEVVIEQN